MEVLTAVIVAFLVTGVYASAVRDRSGTIDLLSAASRTTTTPASTSESRAPYATTTSTSGRADSSTSKKARTTARCRNRFTMSCESCYWLTKRRWSSPRSR